MTPRKKRFGRELIEKLAWLYHGVKYAELIEREKEVVDTLLLTGDLLKEGDVLVASWHYA